MISIELYTIIVKFMASGSTVQAQGRSKYCHLEKCKNKTEQKTPYEPIFFLYLLLYYNSREK